MFRLLALALPLLAGTPANFKHVGGKNGVEVYRQMNSPAIDLFAEGDIEAPPSVVRDVLLDYPNASKVTDNVAESRVLQKSDREIIVYQRLKLPIISDRDFTLRATWGARGQVLTMQYAVDNSRGPAEREGIVRLSMLQGRWDLQPIRGGAATHARYRVVIDLAGSVPKWMVSGGAAKNIPKVFDGVRKQAQGRVPGTPVAGRGSVVQ
ncbi:MAG: Collagenase [bacterium]|nr:Collagenase [bacterium]